MSLCRSGPVLRGLAERASIRGMRSFDELERMWLESPPAPRTRGVVRLICVRKGDGVHECPERVEVTPEEGVVGDRWAKKPDRDADTQVTLIAARVAELIAADHAPLHQAGDNFVVQLDLGTETLPVGTRVRLGSALLEISAAPHAGCKTFRERFGVEALQWVNYRPHKERRLRGVNCRVLTAGSVSIGDVVAVDQPPRAGDP